MSATGKVKEAAGYVKEETGEKMKDGKMAQEGRMLRNEGRMEDGKQPMLHKPGTGHPPTKEEDNEA